MATTFRTFEVRDENLIKGETTILDIQFADPVVGLEVSDFSLEGVRLTDLKSSDGGRTWTATVTPLENYDDTGGISLNPGTYANAIDFTNGSGNRLRLNVDTTVPNAPSVDFESTGTDDVYSEQEVGADGTITATVTVASDTQVGDTLTINGTDYTVTQAIIDNGQQIEVEPNTQVTASITDQAGNNSGSVKNTAPPADIEVDTPSVTFEDTGSDDIYNNEELGEDGTITATITVPEGTQVGDTLTVTTPNGSEQIEVTQDVIDNGYDVEVAPEAEVSTSITDQAGNTSDDVTATAPGADVQGPTDATTQLTVNDITEDNTINAAEAEESIAVTGNVEGEFTEGDKVTLNVNGTDYTGSVDAEGNFSIDVAGSDLAADNDTVIDAQIAATDAAGNTGTILATKDYAVDVTATDAPSVTFEDTGSDDIYNADEVGEDGTVSATITVPEGTEAGDTLTVTTPNGSETVEVTQDIIDNGYDVEVAPEAEVSASITDQAGNTSDDVTATAPGADVQGPTDATTQLTINDITADNTVNSEEAAQTIAVTGQVTGEYSAGDTVTLNVNGTDYTGSVDAEGNFSIDVAGSDLAADNDTVIDAQIAATDTAGNTGTIRATKDYALDMTATDAPSVTFEDTGSDDIYNNEELGEDGTVTATITVPEGTEAGDTLTVTTPNGSETVTVDQDIIDNGYDVEVEPGSDITANITDSAGNTSDDVTATAPGADVQGPTDATTQLTINDITEDNTINAAEAGESIAVTGSVSGEFNEGDKVTLNVNGTDYTGSVDDEGNFSIDVAGSDLAADNDTVIDAQIAATDAAGNEGTITATKDYRTDTIAPTAPSIGFEGTGDDDIYNSEEVGEDGTVTATITVPEGTQVDDSLTITTPEGSETVTVDQDIIDNGYAVEVEPGSNITASITDSAGNTSDDVTATAPGADVQGPEASMNIGNITEDNILNAAEAGETIAVTGVVTGEFTAGDDVVLTVNGKAFEGKLDSNGTFSIDVPGSDLAADADSKVVGQAYVSDAAGNITRVPDSQGYTVDTQGPEASMNIGSITEDNILNAAEAGETIAVTGVVTGEFTAGDDVVLTVNGKAFEGTLDRNGTFSIDVPGSDLAADADNKVVGRAFVTDSAGNTAEVPDSQAYGVDVEGPKAKMDIDGITADNILNAAEANQTIAVTGTVTGEFTPGDEVVLTVNNNEYTGSLNDQGRFSIDIPGSDLAADTDSKVVGRAFVTDSAGNIAEVPDSQAYTAASEPLFLYHLGYDLTQTAGPEDAYGKVGDEINYLTTKLDDEIYIGFKGFDDQGNLICSPCDGDFERDACDPDVNWHMDTAEGDDLVYIREDQNGHTYTTLGAGNDTYYVGGKLDACLSEVCTDPGARSYIFAESGNDSIVIGGNGEGRVTGWGVDGGRIFAGSGSDDVIVYGEVDDGGVIDLGSGSTTYANEHNEAKSADGADDINSLTITRNLGEAARYDYGVVQGGQGQDDVMVNGAINGYSRVSLGGNDDSLSAYKVRHHSKVSMGGGDDAVVIDCTISGRSVIDLDSGNNTLEVGRGIHGAAKISAGSGNDVVSVGEDIDGASHINLEDGNNVLSVAEDIEDCVVVNMGNGNDVVTVDRYIEDSSQIITGRGNDSLTTKGVNNCATVEMGAGDDTLIIQSQFGIGAGSADVDMGWGNDVATFGGSYMDGVIEGNKGDDTLELTSNSHYSNISSANFRGIETVDLKGDIDIKIDYKDLVNDQSREGALFIKGDRNNCVDIDMDTSQGGWFGWFAQDTERWYKAGSEKVDGVTYDIYHHNTAGSDTTNDLYIEQGVAVI